MESNPRDMAAVGAGYGATVEGRRHKHLRPTAPI